MLNGPNAYILLCNTLWYSFCWHINDTSKWHVIDVFISSSLALEEHGNFDLYEYVPSSNPGSQELCVDLDFIIKSDKEEILHHTDHRELFEEDIRCLSASPDCK